MSAINGHETGFGPAMDAPGSKRTICRVIHSLHRTVNAAHLTRVPSSSSRTWGMAVSFLNRRFQFRESLMSTMAALDHGGWNTAREQIQDNGIYLLKEQIPILIQT